MPAKSGSFGMPSAQTLFHVLARDRNTRAAIDRARMMLGPLLQLRDKNNAEQIKNARTAAELVAHASSARGLAEAIWYARVHEFGPEIVPPIAQQLRATRDIPDKKRQDLAYDRLITALRWEGTPGAQALVDVFSSLDEYGQSLACVALGLLKHRPAADLIWQFYQKVVDNPESYLVGALWGLIDLQDPRTGGALVDLLRAGDHFEELYGFLALAGDVHAVEPLAAVIEKRGDEAEEAGMALACIAHRIGRNAFVEELSRLAAPGDPRAEIEAAADQVLNYPREAAEKYFDLYFHTVHFDEVAKSFGRFMQ